MSLRAGSAIILREVSHPYRHDDSNCARGYLSGKNGGNFFVDDRNEKVIDTLTNKVFGKLYADKGYISQTLFGHLWDDGVHIVTGLRSNMKQRLMPLYDKIMLRKRSIIESINDMLKNVAQLVHSRHRSVHNFIMNLLAAMGAYCFFATKPDVNFEYEVPESNRQIVLWQ